MRKKYLEGPMKNILTFIITLVLFSQAYAQKEENVDIVLGNKDAPFKVIEYTSLTCNHCADFHLNVMPKIKDQHIRTGQVQVIIRPYVMDRVALVAYKLVNALPQDKREAGLTRLFSTQVLWIEKEPEEIGEKLGLTPKQVQAALKNKRLEDALFATTYKARTAHKIDATPTFLFGSEKVEGTMSLEEFKDKIQKNKT